MPPPKRPFTTSSLTSSLKSTFANQPLLNNLTNIDKLSSQASSLAQKTPFFGAINQQFQQHYQQQQQQEGHNQQDAGQGKTTQNQANVTSGVRGSGSGSGSGNNPQGEPNASRTNADMFRNVQTTNQGRAPAPQVPVVASTPAVDMSHLTEEERAMIQSVMAKAEMADMGLPIDTSMPSSTNLPSNTSQALTQQRDQQQKQQQMEQHRKQQMQNAAAASNDLNQQHQLNSSQQNQQHLNQSQSFQQQQLTQDKQEFNIENQHKQQQEMANQMSVTFRQNDPSSSMMQQQQHQALDQPNLVEANNQSNTFGQQLALNQAGIDTDLSANQAANSYYRQDINQNMIVSNENLGYTEKNKQQAQTLDQQSIMQTTGAMNPVSISIERTLQPSQNPSLNPQQQQPRFITNDSNQGMLDLRKTQYAPNSDQMNTIHNAQQLTGVPFIQSQQYNFQDSFNQTQHLKQLQVQAQLQPVPQTQIDQVTGLTGNLEHTQPLPNSVNHLDRPFESGNPALSTNFMNSPNLDEQIFGGNAAAQYQVGTNLYVQNPLFELANQQYVKPMIVKPRVRPRSNIEASSDIDYEHAFSDLEDQRAVTRKRGARSNQPMSRHESVETDRRSLKRSRDRGIPRDLQAYDLANQRIESRSEQKSRRLPQPGCSNQSKLNSRERSVQSPSEHLPEYRQKSREDKMYPRRTDVTQKPAPTRPKSASRRISKSRHYHTETDPDYDSQSGTDSTEHRTKPKEIEPARKSPVAKESEKKEVADNQEKLEVDDENEEALALLKTLKLTEHANQVMQQQQLLIKQSQELIKLQQAQLEQQSEAKKNGSDKQARSQPGDGSASESIIERKLSNEKRSDDETSSTIRSLLGENANGSDKSNAKKNSSIRETKEIGSKSKREEFDGDESVRTSHEILHEIDQTKKSDRRGSSRLSQNHGNQSPRLLTSNRRERDILQSPTDTTDSDAELVPRSSSRLRQQKQSSRLGTAQKVRREPQGLPPSPLPVAAAIQLHQMQQKHKNQLATSNLPRASYLRSRSVTSSPNHMLDRLVGSGYMTDDQKRRPTSPDTLSEYGGLRRRKRLPNPPQNVLPITPSVVRRLNQVNRMTASGPGVSATAANLRSTTTSSALSARLAKNTNFNPRFPSSSINQSNPYHHKPNLDRSNFTSSARLTSNSVPAGSSISSKYQINSDQSTSSANPLTMPFGFDSISAVTNLTKSNSRSHPSSSLNYYDSMIGESEINDIKETPELDKLISNLDAYYNLENSTGTKFNQHASTTKPISSAHLDNSHLTSITRPLDTRLYTSSYGSPRGLQTQPYSNLSTTTETAPMGLNRSRKAVDDYASAYPSILSGHDHTSNQHHMLASSYPTSSYYVTSTSSPSSSRQHNLSSHQADSDASSAFKQYPSLRMANWQSIDQPNYARDPYFQNFNSPSQMATSRRYSYESATNDLNFNMSAPQHELIRPTGVVYNRTSYTDDTQRKYESEFRNMSRQADNRENVSIHQPINQFGSTTNSVTPLTKADIINNGPKFDSIGYRFRTESLNKYVTDQRNPIECLQSKYLYPYKRILLSKNPKDRIGNGIGVKIVGGQLLPSLYDKVNKCIVTSGAFVTEVFQSSRVYFMDEMHEGDQIIEWNGVNLCNRSDEEVQQILYSQFSDDEVEIIYLNRDKFFEAYNVCHERSQLYTAEAQRGGSYEINDTFDVFSRLNKTSVGSKKSRTLGLDRGSFFMNSR